MTVPETTALYAHASGRNTWLEMSTKAHKQLQFGVLPCRVAGNGRVQVMLLTSRETGRWVIPKGWPMKGKKPREVAA
jgi:8-oxo-dGTP pyrophosphatase MutT (NUDIX family)